MVLHKQEIIGVAEEKEERSAHGAYQAGDTGYSAGAHLYKGAAI